METLKIHICGMLSDEVILGRYRFVVLRSRQRLQLMTTNARRLRPQRTIFRHVNFRSNGSSTNDRSLSSTFPLLLILHCCRPCFPDTSRSWRTSLNRNWMRIVPFVSSCINKKQRPTESLPRQGVKWRMMSTWKSTGFGRCWSFPTLPKWTWLWMCIFSLAQLH